MFEEFKASIKKMITGELNDPVVCPCCKVLHKVYKRGITGAMTNDLIRFYNEFGIGYGHLTGIKINGGGDFAKLRFWGLIDAAPENLEGFGGRTNGYWKVTEEGVRFIFGHCSIIKYQHVLNGRVVGESGSFVTVTDSLGNNFDYSELMAR